MLLLHVYLQDALLEKFAATDTFDEEEITEFRRSFKSLIVRYMNHLAKKTNGC